MGGNAIKCAKRMNATEFHEISEEVSRKVSEFFGVFCDVVPAYLNKKDFGDIDIVIQSDHLPPDWVEKIIKHLGSKEWVKNDVLSLEYRGVQVDLIPTKGDIYDFALNYFSWNDLGNLIGRIAHGFDTKFGHDGLWYIVYDPECPTNKIGEILLTDQFDVALNFLGFMPSSFHAGFDDLEDIFKYVAESDYFSKDRYPLEHRSHAARIRDRKRKTYMSFLKWIDKNQPEDHFDFTKDAADEEVNRQRIADYFDDFTEEYEKIIEANEKRKEVNKHFGGEVVSEITGLKGKSLGEFMGFMRGKLTKEQFVEYASGILDIQKKSNWTVIPIFIAGMYNRFKERNIV